MSGPAGLRARGRRLLPALVLLLAAALALVLTLGRGDDPGTAAAPAPSSAPPPAEEEPVDPDAVPTPTEPVAPATEAAAAPVVLREGVPESARTVEATPADFTEPARWSDGAAVRLVEARQGITSDTGPGALAGQPQVVFTLEVTNGSGAPLDLGAVVVQAAYGSAATQASPLYDDGTVDFSGVVEPGGTATAVYSFAVPEDQLGGVTLSVDVDGHRFPAVFSGAVPVR
ncbi:hypothetical protein ACI797_03460 [Geodermatophilus sp. SYSU D00691]